MRLPADPQALARDAEAIARELPVPPCPAVLSAFAAEMASETPDMKKLAALIGEDVALAAAVLQAANSPLYGLRNKVTLVGQALSVLGLRAGSSLVAGLMLRRAFPPGSAAAMQRFWDQSTRMAQTAAELATGVHGLDPTEAQAFALFRDCGAAVMLARFPQYPALYDALRTHRGIRVTATEDLRFRFSHARVGYALARGWQLPEPLANSILLHHEIEALAEGRREAEPARPALVAFGLLIEQIIALREGRGICPDWDAGEDFALRTLKLNVADVVRLASGPSARAA